MNDTNGIAIILSNLGLNDKQAKVYLACLELGTATVQELSKKSGVKRTSIYNFIDELKTKGLVGEVTQDHRTYLIPEDPRALIRQVEIKKRELEKEKDKIQEMLPQLMSIFNLPGEKPKIKFYEGVEGIKKVYEDTLAGGGNICAFSDYEKMLNVMDFDYMVNYADRRASKGISFKSIGPTGPMAKKASELGAKQKREMKTAEDVKFETEINIYGNKVALISFNRPYAGVIIENRAIAQTMKSIWKWMWARMP